MELLFRCPSHTTQPKTSSLSSKKIIIIFTNTLITNKNIHIISKKRTQYFHKHPPNFTNIHILFTRVAEVVRGYGGPSPKSLDSDENLKPEHTLFCRELRFVAIYALFGDLWAKSAFLGQKQRFLGKKCIIKWWVLQIILS